MTSTKRYVLLGSVLVLILGALAYFLLSGKSATPAGQTNSGASGSTLPTAGSTPAPAVGTTSGAVPSMTVATLPSGAIVVKDFLHNGVTTEDVQNPGNYYLAGTVGYCLKDGTCPSGAPSSEYHVVYNTIDQAFYIALLKEPLGQARIDAEQFLMRTLGVLPSELCTLKYFISTAADVSPQYAGKNLLFSFCPGAVALP